jgi:hypothetical protein
MKPFKRSQTGSKRLNALGMAGALSGDAGSPSSVDAGVDGGDRGHDQEHSLIDEDGTRAQRFATDLDGNRFREVSIFASVHFFSSADV